MRRAIRALVLCAGLFGSSTLLAASAQAQTGWYLLLEGQGGPISMHSGVLTSGLTDTTEVLGYGQNFFLPLDPQGVPGQLSFRPLRILKLVDGSSPRLAEALATSETITTCKLTHYQLGGTPTALYEITLATPQIIGVAGGSDATSVGTETVSIAFARVTLKDVASGQTTTIP